MDRSLLENSLAEIEQLIADSERQVSAQQNLISKLEQAGHGNHETAHNAHEILRSMESTLGRRLRERRRLRVELRRGIACHSTGLLIRPAKDQTAILRRPASRTDSISAQGRVTAQSGVAESSARNPAQPRGAFAFLATRRHQH